jgi:hypothetical protein
MFCAPARSSGSNNTPCLNVTASVREFNGILGR